MLEQVMNEIENSMVCGLQFEESYPETEPEFERDTSLVDELSDIARLQNITSEIDALVESLNNTTYGKLQA